MIVLWICLALSVVGAGVLFAAQLSLDRDGGLVRLRLAASFPAPARPALGRRVLSRDSLRFSARREPEDFATPASRAVKGSLAPRHPSGLRGDAARWPPAARPSSLENERASISAVSILKPLKGGDPGLEENLESFYRQDHPEYEIVFSFASREDDAFPVARRVADRHPEVATSFVFDAREPGRNPKVSRLLAAVTRARHPILLISDGDVRVAPGYLRRSIAEFEDPSVGLV